VLAQVEDAIVCLDYIGHDFYVFRNDKTKDINVRRLSTTTHPTCYSGFLQGVTDELSCAWLCVWCVQVVYKRKQGGVGLIEPGK
jgi:hypothetical protein